MHQGAEVSESFVVSLPKTELIFAFCLTLLVPRASCLVSSGSFATVFHCVALQFHSVTSIDRNHAGLRDFPDISVPCWAF